MQKQNGSESMLEKKKNGLKVQTPENHSEEENIDESSPLVQKKKSSLFQRLTSKRMSLEPKKFSDLTQLILEKE